MSLKELHTPRHWPTWIAGTASDAGELAEVTHSGDGSVIGTYTVPDATSVEAALEGAWQVRREAQRTSAAQRAAALTHVSRRLEERLPAARVTALRSSQHC